MSKIRKHSALKDGEFNILYSKESVFAFERFNGKERIVVVVNLSNKNLYLNLDGEYLSFIKNKKVKGPVVYPNGVEILIEEKKNA